MVGITTTSKPTLHQKTSISSIPHRKLGLGCLKLPRLCFKISNKSIYLTLDCKQSTIVNGLCFHFDERMPYDYGIPFNYIFHGLRLTLDEIARLKLINSEKVFSCRKLNLVLDLDHTLLHTKSFKNLKLDEFYLKKQTDSDISNGRMFILDDDELVKLRPFVQTFLKEASSMFEISICSMGSRHYVKKVAEFLDPEGKYFDTRLIAREDFKDRASKDLDLVLGQECGTVTVDDTEDVWSDHLDNLITVERYSYFRDNGRNHKSHA